MTARTQALGSRLVLVGRPGTAFREAAQIAAELGTDVVLTDSPDAALERLRAGGGDLVMIDVCFDVVRFMTLLRAERFAVPVLACGVDAPADRAVAAIRAGAADYVPLPPDRDMIAAAIMSSIERRPPLVTCDKTLLEAVAIGRALSAGSAPLLLVGEAGTGKEVLAHAIHESAGRSGRFIAVETRGVSPDIIESELFGHESDAASGLSHGRAGALETAAGGTVLVTELCVLTQHLQARLIEWLRRPQPGVLLVLATRRDIHVEAEDGKIRADLAMKLGKGRLHVPPLRDRRADIPLLARWFAERTAEAQGVTVPQFSDAAMARLQAWDWPGNVRELEDVIYRAVLLSAGGSVEPELLGIDPAPASVRPELSGVDNLVGQSVDEVERALILKTLESCRGNRTAASAILGISIRTMRNKLKAFEAGAGA